MTTLSVVIPARNRPEVLARALECWARQRLAAATFEVVVVDDGSEPPLADVLAPPRSLKLQLLRGTSRGPAAARNRGVEAARGEITVFTGDDILPPQDFLAHHLRWHQQHPSAWEGMLGLVRWPEEYLTDNYMRWLAESGLQFGYKGLKPHQDLRYYCFYTSNLSLKTNLLRRFPFDEDFPDATHEDTDLGLRLSERGFRLYYEPTAVVEHHHFYTLEQSLAHRRRVGRAGFLFHQKHPKEANFKWIRRTALPLRPVFASRAYLRIAEFAQLHGDAQWMGHYYYYRNSEAFWEGYREAAAHHNGS